MPVVLISEPRARAQTCLKSAASCAVSLMYSEVFSMPELQFGELASDRDEWRLCWFLLSNCDADAPRSLFLLMSWGGAMLT